MKKLLMLALVATLFSGISAYRNEGQWNQQRASRGKAHGLATIAGAALGAARVGLKGDLFELGVGMVIGALTVNGYTVLVRETADPVIVNQLVGVLIKHGAAITVSGFVGNAVWNSVFRAIRK